MMGEAQAALSLLNLAGKALSGPPANRVGAESGNGETFAASLSAAQQQTPAAPASQPGPTSANGSAQSTTSASDAAPKPADGNAADKAGKAPDTASVRHASTAGTDSEGKASELARRRLADTSPEQTNASDASILAIDNALAPAFLGEVSAEVSAAGGKRGARRTDDELTSALTTGLPLTAADQDSEVVAGSQATEFATDDKAGARVTRWAGLSNTPGAAADTDQLTMRESLTSALAADGASGEAQAAAGGDLEQQIAELHRAFGLQGSGATQRAGQPTSIAQAQITTPVPDPKFSRALAEQVNLFVAGDIKSASITVSPPDMGPIRIELAVKGDEARLVFTSAHPETRQAIEQSASVLRSMLAERGVSLGQMDVGQGNPQQQGFDQRDGAGAASTGGHWTPTGVDRDALTAATTSAIEQAAARRNIGLLDLFA